MAEFSINQDVVTETPTVEVTRRSRHRAAARAARLSPCRVRRLGNNSIPDEVVVIVADTSAPTAVLSAPRAVAFGSSFLLDGSRSFDAGGGKVVRYVWTSWVGREAPTPERQTAGRRPQRLDPASDLAGRRRPGAGPAPICPDRGDARWAAQPAGRGVGAGRAGAGPAKAALTPGAASAEPGHRVRHVGRFQLGDVLGRQRHRQRRDRVVELRPASWRRRSAR